MSLILLNLQSNQQIKLNNDAPLIIGRGNVDGCFDKRVSRNHGRVTCTDDGKVRLAALHCNPCFFTRNGVPPVVQLNKDEEETLNEGDFLGLLPNAFWFKVTSSSKNDIKKKLGNSAINTNNETDRTIVIDNCNTSHSHVEEITISEESECAFSDRSNKDNLKPSTSNQESSSWKYGDPEFEKTKRLPLWMYEIDDPVKSDSKKHSLEEVREAKLKKQKILPESEIKKEIETKSDFEVKSEEKEARTLDAPSTSKVEVVPPVCKSEPQEETNNDRSSGKEGYESSVDEENPKRPICQYEGNCYRKNPQHKLDFTHPGDPDFVPYEERPLCVYGAACFRKNEKHKVEFRHPPPDTCSQSLSSSSPSPGSRGEERPPCLSGSTCRNQNPQHRKELYHPPKASSPLPAKRRRKNVYKQNFDYEDEDEYDLEDPFINDASSDEYLPSDLESEEEDDLNESREDE